MKSNSYKRENSPEEENADAKFGVFTSQWFKTALKTNARHALLIFLRSELREAAVFSQCAAVITDATVKKRPSNTVLFECAGMTRNTKRRLVFLYLDSIHRNVSAEFGGGLAY